MMRRLRYALIAMVIAALGLVGFSALPAQAASSPALRIMPLGDSITWGVGSSTNSSYRAALWNLVTAAGYPLDFVGSQQSGSLPDTDNEGHSGFRIDQIASLAPCAVGSTRPNVVTLHLGTNDMNQNYQVGTAPARLGALIDQILAFDPGVTVLVATLIPSSSSDVESRIVSYNQQLPALVQARQNAGKHVRLVDMSAVTTGDLSDNLHPNDGGYVKMANAFYAGLQASLSAGWIQAPVAQSSAAGSCVSGAVKGQQSGRCIDVPNASQADGTRLALWDCNDGVNQEWKTSPSKQLIVYGSECLDAYGAGTADGTPVEIWTCTGGNNQQWTVNADGTIVGAGSGKCLAADSQNTADSTPLVLATCNGGANQQWTTSMAGSLKGQESGRCVDVPGGNPADGTMPALWDCNGGPNQAWVATPTGRLTVFDTQCLDVVGGTANGSKVDIWDCNGGANQQWTVNSDGTVVSLQSGRCLDATAHGTANGTPLEIWDCNGGANQKWNRS